MDVVLADLSWGGPLPAPPPGRDLESGACLLRLGPRRYQCRVRLDACRLASLEPNDPGRLVEHDVLGGRQVIGLDEGEPEALTPPFGELVEVYDRLALDVERLGQLALRAIATATRASTKSTWWPARSSVAVDGNPSTLRTRFARPSGRLYPQCFCWSVCLLGRMSGVKIKESQGRTGSTPRRR